MSQPAAPDPEIRRQIIAASIEAETAFRASVRRFALTGFAIGFVLGALFGAQAILSEGLATGLWFVFGVGFPAGFGGAILAAPVGILLGFARRRSVIRRLGFSPAQVEAAAAEDVAGG